LKTLSEIAPEKPAKPICSAFTSRMDTYVLQEYGRIVASASDYLI